MTSAVAKQVATFLSLLVLLSPPGIALAVNKCIDSSGGITFSNKPCNVGSKTEKLSVKKEENILHSEYGRKARSKYRFTKYRSEGGTDDNSIDFHKKWSSREAYDKYYCSTEANKHLTPAQHIAEAKAILRGDIPTGQVCCLNGTVVPCKGGLGLP